MRQINILYKDIILFRGFQTVGRSSKLVGRVMFLNNTFFYHLLSITDTITDLLK